MKPVVANFACDAMDAMRAAPRRDLALTIGADGSGHTPRPGGGRALQAEAQDTGALLSALGFGKLLPGGRLELRATQAGAAPRAPIAGTAELADFVVRDAPAIGKLLQALNGQRGADEASVPTALSPAGCRLPARSPMPCWCAVTV